MNFKWFRLSINNPNDMLPLIDSLKMRGFVVLKPEHCNSTVWAVGTTDRDNTILALIAGDAIVQEFKNLRHAMQLHPREVSIGSIDLEIMGMA